MSNDRAEWVALTRQRLAKAAREQRPMHEFQARAAVKAEALTGEESWDFFLSFLQEARDRSANVADTHRAALGNPDLVDPLAVEKARRGIFLADERVRLIDAIMLLPKDLIAVGKEAKSLLARLDDDAEAA